MTKNIVQNRYGSYFKVFYPDFPSFDVTPQNIKLFQETGMQDVVEITYPRFGAFYIRALKTGVPISITWNNDKAKSNWFGYVYDIKKNDVQALERPVVVRCIASSLALKEGGSKIWLNKTAPDIVADIAKKFKLKPIVTPHKMIFSQQSLSGHTYWEKVQELGARIGYAAHVIGTELHFHPMDKMIDKFMTTIPIMSYIDTSLAPLANPKDQTLDVFRANLGEYSDMQDSARKIKNVYGVDPISAKLYSATSSATSVGKTLRTEVSNPLFTQTVSRVASETKEMAKVIADAQAQFSRFIHHATGAGQGDPRIAPYRTIELSGTGEQTDGFWVVKKATHFMAWGGRYTVEFSCMTDGRGTNKKSVTRPSSAGLVPSRNVQEEISTARTTRPTSSKLSSPTMMVNQTKAGFKVAPRRWVGR